MLKSRLLPPAPAPAADGISIPSSYTAHLSPLSSSKLFNEVTGPTREAKQAETPYVVMFQAVNILSGDAPAENGRCGPKVQECWAFEHPRRDLVLDGRGLPLTNSHNTRSAQCVLLPASPSHRHTLTSTPLGAAA
jgi:protein arginine N-methyltransferase 5